MIKTVIALYIILVLFDTASNLKGLRLSKVDDFTKKEVFVLNLFNLVINLIIGCFGVWFGFSYLKNPTYLIVFFIVLFWLRDVAVNINDILLGRFLYRHYMDSMKKGVMEDANSKRPRG